jgi:hypothetical protein
MTHQQQSRTRFIAVSLRLNGRPRSDRASRRSTGCARKKVSPAPRKVKRVRYLHGVGRRQANEGRRNKAQGTALSWPYDADYEREFMLADRHWLLSSDGQRFRQSLSDRVASALAPGDRRRQLFTRIKKLWRSTSWSTDPHITKAMAAIRQMMAELR